MKQVNYRLNWLKRGIISSVFMLLFFVSYSGAQGLTSLFFDFSGVQSVLVDTNGLNGPTHMFTKDAKGQFAFGVKAFEMNTKRSLHFGFIIGYRQINLSTFHLHDDANAPLYEKRHVWEVLFGGTYLKPKPLLQTEKKALHFTLSAYGGLQNLSFGSNLSGGFVFLSKDGVAGLTIEFVYRPMTYSWPLADASIMAHDPYYITLKPSWAIRAALTFGKNLQYETN